MYISVLYYEIFRSAPIGSEIVLLINVWDRLLYRLRRLLKVNLLQNHALRCVQCVHKDCLDVLSGSESKSFFCLFSYLKAIVRRAIKKCYYIYHAGKPRGTPHRYIIHIILLLVFFGASPLHVAIILLPITCMIVRTHIRNNT